MRDLFLEQRPARIALTGSGPHPFPAWFGQFASQWDAVTDCGWQRFSHINGASVYILDTCGNPPESYPADIDLFIFMHGTSSVQHDLESFAHFLKNHPAPVVLCNADGAIESKWESQDFLSLPANRIVASTSPSDPLFSDILCAALPPCCRLQFARMTRARKAQALIASTLLGSFSAACGIIGLQPIPLADLPVLTSLQGFMVALIIHVSGRPLQFRLGMEFIGSLGISVGAGFLFRETARAVLRIIPFWGDAISGFIAGAGTYALGRAAIAYFIEDSPIHKTRRLFKSLLKTSGKLQNPSLNP